MPAENHFRVVELATLSWPPALHIPSRRFRLFVAMDANGSATQLIPEFAHAALKSGMVYFCAWGPGCSKVHDIVDEVIVEDELGEHLFVGANAEHTIMTTWHETDKLDEALDFSISLAHPTVGFKDDSDYWVAVCVNNPEWAAVIRRQLGQAEFRAQSSGNRAAQKFQI